jgi:hypothetical protein
MKTINIFRFGIIVFVALFVTSCGKDNLEPVTPVSENKEMPVIEPVTFDYKYNYKGQIYTEKEWQDKNKNVETPSFSVIGLNEMLYVFDEREEADFFEKEKLESKRLELKSKNKISLTNKNSRTNADEIVATTNVYGRISFYENVNLKGTIYTVYFDKVVELRKDRWGQRYKANNVFQGNLPSFFDKKTSSFIMSYVTGGSLPGPKYDLPLTMYAAINSSQIPTPPRETNFSYSRRLHNNPPWATDNKFTDSDLTDNALIVWLPTVGNNTWNDAPRSYKVEFD